MDIQHIRNKILFQWSFVTEIVYGKIFNYVNRMGLLLECESSGGSVVENKSN